MVTYGSLMPCQYWLASLFRGLPATLRQLRGDRILEASATGGDPLHLAAMFGLGGKAGLRYAEAVQPELSTLTPEAATPTRRTSVTRVHPVLDHSPGRLTRRA